MKRSEINRIIREAGIIEPLLLKFLQDKDFFKDIKESTKRTVLDLDMPLKQMHDNIQVFVNV